MVETKTDRGEYGTDRGLRLIPQAAVFSCKALGFWLLVDLSRSLYSSDQKKKKKKKDHYILSLFSIF